jgi:glutamate synthase domain-containing protein 3
VEEMIGRVDRLEMEPAVDHWKAKGVDLSAILYKPAVDNAIPIRCVTTQDHGLSKSLDYKIIEQAKPALENKKPVKIELPINNVNRAVGAILSSEISLRYEAEGLPADTIHCKFKGSAGQSFGAWLAPGVTLELEGDTNDYVGKGLSGGRIVVYPPKEATYVPEENIIVGNVALYGAVKGEAYFRGMGGERFAVRNSGVKTVVESVGDHGCEYMTGGVVTVLGATGRNFAAGMSGGIAYVFDADKTFKIRCNLGMVDLEPVVETDDKVILKDMVQKHFDYTGSTVAKKMLDNWDSALTKFVKVFPKEYRRALSERMSGKSQGSKVAQPSMGGK